MLVMQVSITFLLLTILVIVYVKNKQNLFIIFYNSNFSPFSSNYLAKRLCLLLAFSFSALIFLFIIVSFVFIFHILKQVYTCMYSPIVLVIAQVFTTGKLFSWSVFSVSFGRLFKNLFIIGFARNKDIKVAKFNSPFLYSELSFSFFPSSTFGTVSFLSSKNKVSRTFLSIERQNIFIF